MTETEKVKISRLIEGANGSRGVLESIYHRYGDILIDPTWLSLNKGELFRRLTAGTGNNTHDSAHDNNYRKRRCSLQR